MQVDCCVTFSRCSTTALPARNQLIWQRDGTAVFEHDRLKSAHQLQRHFPICLHDNTGHLLQNGMQEVGTCLGEAFVDRRICHLYLPQRRHRCKLLQASIGMTQPAKDQRLQQVCSAEFSLPLDTACLAGQDVGSLFEDVFQGMFHL